MISNKFCVVSLFMDILLNRVVLNFETPCYSHGRVFKSESTRAFSSKIDRFYSRLYIYQ